MAAAVAWQPEVPDGEPAPDAGEASPDQPAAKPSEGAKDLEAEETLARFRQLLQRRPFHGPAFTGLVNHAIERGTLQELVDEFVARAAALPDDQALRIILARLHLRAGNAAAAQAILEPIAKLGGELGRMNVELLVLKAEVYQQTGDNASAEKMLKEAQAQAGSVSERLRLGEAVADLYIRDGRREEAGATLEKLAAEFPDNYSHQKHIAEAMAQRGLHEAAVARYQAMLPLVKDEVDRKCETLRSMGQSLERLQKRDEAIAAYVEAVGLLNSDHWLQRELHERIVALYRSANRLGDLAAYCTGQIARAPEQTAMRVLLADVQNAMGKPDQARKTLEEAVTLFPKDQSLSQKRIDLLERLGDLDAVSEEYQRIIGQHPDDIELYVAYGQRLANNRKIDAARNQWRHVLNTQVGDAGLALRLGGLFEAYELADDAGEAYERAISIDPKRPEAYSALARLWLVRNEPEKAVATLERMGTANPQDGSVQAALAQELRNIGKTDEALTAITRACELLPEQVRYQTIRSDLLIQTGELAEALKVRRASIDKIANTPQQAEAIATLVSMYASAGKVSDLRTQEEAEAKSKPEGAVPLLILARAADVERDFTAVRRNLDALLKLDPGNETALQQLAKLQDATGDIDAASATYTQLVQRYPGRARQFYEAIVDLKLRYSDRAGAIESLQKMAQSDPASAATQAGVGEQLVRMQEPERALPYFEKSLQIQPDRHETRLDYGKALADAGRLDDAITAFRAVATQRSDTDRAIEALGRLHDTAGKVGKLEELMDELEREVEAEPSNTLIATALARLLVHELEYSRALELLDLVLRNNPRDLDLAMVRAEVLRRLARYDEAVAAYQGVLHLPQVDRDFVQGELGKAYFESGQVDQARRVWRQIQHKLYAGTLLKNNGLLEDAVAVLEEGIRQKPDESALHRNLIDSYETAGRTPDALNAAKRLLDLEPGNVWNIERLAEAFLRSGDRTAAAAVASRLFSASVGPDKPGAQGSSGGGYQSLSGAMSAAAYSGYSSYYGQGGRSNLERGIAFFMRSGLRAELEEVLTQQLAAQPDNALLKDKASGLYSTQLNKPELALDLLRQLETATFPIEHQDWLGQCSQQDWMRIRQYNLIATKPALRDRELAALEAKGAGALTRDELIEFAVIRKAQGNSEASAELLGKAAQGGDDTLALGLLTELLVSGEKFAEAEPHARRLVEALTKRREAMHAQTVERVRRDYVRSLPLELQLRVTEELLSDIAEKWTLGEGWSWYDTGTTQAVGFLRAKLTLGTILAETGRIDEARAVWQDLAPKRAPDVDRFTMLGDTAELHKQEDLAFAFYQEALRAAKKLAGDSLLQQVYASSTTTRSWYDEGGVDKAFGNIVEAFSKRKALPELYDFLRDTDQEQRARRVAEQYNLADDLKTRYAERVAQAAEAFRTSADGPFRASPAYFAQVCKLAELADRQGDWEGAQAVYAAYLKDFPDELGLVQMLGEVAEARLDTEGAIEWEKKVLACKDRLARRAREWSLRELTLTPSIPKALADETDAWSWASRWSSTRASSYGYSGRTAGQFDRWPSWMRLAELYLASNNTIAAADAMQQAVAEAGAGRSDVVDRITSLIQQRQLTAQMLPVLRTLAVYAPDDERVQLAFAESLEAGGRKELALEVCSRMLRRGVSDLGILAEVQRRVASLGPENAAPEITVATLEADVKADPTNLKNRLRLGKAYFYSLDVNRAIGMLAPLAAEAPHLEDVHDMLVEAYTLRGDSEKLVEALRAQADRTSDEHERRRVRWRLVDELLGAGKTDDALTIVKELGDPRDPNSYSRIGTLLQYFGKGDEALKLMEEGKKSRSAGRYDGGMDNSVALALALRGDFAGAAEKILSSIDEQSRQQTQYGGMYALFDSGQNSFSALEPTFALYPDLAKEVEARLEARRAAAPADPQALKLLMGLKRSLGRPDQAEALLEQVAEAGAADQALVAQQIDLAVKRRQFDRAVGMAQKFIAQAPKPQIPPGMPAQYAGYALIQSPRTFMLCKLGDVYWDMGEKEKAFETYKQVLDKKVDETRTAYASICLVRGRTDEARALVDEALGAAAVKPPALLQFRAFIAILDGDNRKAFDLLAEAAAPGGDQEDRYDYGRESPITTLSQLATRAGLTDEFAGFMKERIKKNPGEWDDYSTLAQLFYNAGRPDEALAVIDEAAANPSLTRQALTQRLEWRQSIAPAEELIPLYEKIIEMSDREVRSDNSGYGGYGGSVDPSQSYRDALANLYWEEGKVEDAHRLWTQRMNAQRAEAHVRLAQLYFQKQEFDKARQAFERSAQLDPDSVQVHSALARECYVRGDSKGLLEHLRECYLRNPPGESDQSDYRDWSDQGGDDAEMYEWALALSQDPALSAELQSDESSRAREDRVMLAALTGDRPALEALLRPLIDGGTMDPLLWTLWSNVQLAKGDWKEAARALDFLRRVALTSLDDHREKLKLILAGKQVKEAVAGTRQAQPTPGNPQGGGSGYYGGYSGYYSGYYDGYGSSGSMLPSLYLKLGDFQRAERLYLLSSGGDGIGGKLPWLASLMWDQNAKDRALDLMRLALSLSNERSGGTRYQIPQYAAMLSEAGQTKAAADLLVRSYRFDSSGDQAGAYASMYGYSQRQSLEQGYESTTSSALHAILKKAGVFDQTMAELAAESQKDPADPRLSKLVLSLQKQGRQWAAQRESLVARRAKLPSDQALALEQFHAACQLGQWDEALSLIGELRTMAKESADRWNAHEAFVHLMRNDGAKAAAAVEPLLAHAAKGYGAPPPKAAPVVLAATGGLERLAAHLQSQRDGADLDDSGLRLLARVQLAQGRWSDAFALAAEQFWRQATVPGPTDMWWNVATQAANAARLAGGTIAPGTERPADAALLALATGGPSEGVEAFARLTAAPDAAVEAHRGLVFAARLAGDQDRESAAAEQLLSYLQDRRQRAWYTSPQPGLQKRAQAAVEQIASTGATQSALGGMGQSLSTVFQSGSARQTVTYDGLWKAYSKYQRTLVARAGEPDRLRALLRQQERTLESGSYSGYNGYDMYGYSGYQNRGYDEESRTEALADSDPPAFVRASLRNAGRLNELQSEFEHAGARISSSEWIARGEAFAAAGRSDEAAEWRRRDALRKLAQLRATDQPDPTGGAQSPWRWSWYYSSSTQDVGQIRYALRAGTSTNRGPDLATQMQGPMEEPWEVALVDPAVERELVACAASIGPGWDSSETLSTLIQFYRAKDQPKEVLALLDRAVDPERLMQSQQLADYVWACYRSLDAARFEALLAKVQKAGASLDNDIAVARLVMLRLTGKDAEAGELESALLGRCVAEAPSPLAPPPVLFNPPWAGQDAPDYSSMYEPQVYDPYGYNYRNQRSTDTLNLGQSLSHASELAMALGVRYDAKVGTEDLSVETLRSAYQRHDLDAHVARLLEREIAEESDPAQKFSLSMTRLQALAKAGAKEQAQKAARELEKTVLDQAGASPAAAGVVRSRLATLYASDAYGPDLAKSLAALSAAKASQPGCDPGAARAVHCLYKLGKYKEALEAWQAGRSAGRSETYQETTLYYAAISACRAGDPAGPSIARLALYRYPLSPLAKDTRELADAK